MSYVLCLNLDMTKARRLVGNSSIAWRTAATHFLASMVVSETEGSWNANGLIQRFRSRQGTNFLPKIINRQVFGIRIQEAPWVESPPVEPT